jgi:hypothetical protein
VNSRASCASSLATTLSTSAALFPSTGRTWSAPARLAVVWRVGHEAIALVAAERARASLPAPFIREFNLPPMSVAEARDWLAPKPYFS